MAGAAIRRSAARSPSPKSGLTPRRVVAPRAGGDGVCMRGVSAAAA